MNAVIAIWSRLVQAVVALYGVPKRRGAEVLEQVRLSSVAGRNVKTFSTGMRQRLLLARALITAGPVAWLVIGAWALVGYGAPARIVARREI